MPSYFGEAFVLSVLVVIFFGSLSQYLDRHDAGYLAFIARIFMLVVPMCALLWGLWMYLKEII